MIANFSICLAGFKKSLGFCIHSQIIYLENGTQKMELTEKDDGGHPTMISSFP